MNIQIEKAQPERNYPTFIKFVEPIRKVFMCRGCFARQVESFNERCEPCKTINTKRIRLNLKDYLLIFCIVIIAVVFRYK